MSAGVLGFCFRRFLEVIGRTLQRRSRAAVKPVIGERIRQLGRRPPASLLSYPCRIRVVGGDTISLDPGNSSADSGIYDVTSGVQGTSRDAVKRNSLQPMDVVLFMFSSCRPSSRWQKRKISSDVANS